MPELTNRQIKILIIVIENYNNTGETISSQVLKDEFGLSSATIRKELNLLEKCGFLEKRHISSGRIPTKLGYEFYLKNSKENDLVSVNENVKTFLETIKQININTIEQTLEEVSRLTNYTALAFETENDEVAIDCIKYIDLNESSVVLIVTTSNDNSESNIVKFNSSYEKEQFVKIIERLNEELSGVIVSKVETIINKFIKKNIVDELNDYIDYLKFISVVSNKFSKKNLYLSGTSHLFDDSMNQDKVKLLISNLEDNDFSEFEINNDEQDYEISIGENEDDYTIVKVKSNSNEINSLALVGPKRMNYDEILFLLDNIAKNIK